MLEVLFNSAGTAEIPLAEMTTGFMDFPDELKPEMSFFLGGVGDFVPMQICSGGICHYQQVNLSTARRKDLDSNGDTKLFQSAGMLVCRMDVPTGGAGGVRRAEAL